MHREKNRSKSTNRKIHISCDVWIHAKLMNHLSANCCGAPNCVFVFSKCTIFIRNEKSSQLICWLIFFFFLMEIEVEIVVLACMSNAFASRQVSERDKVKWHRCGCIISSLSFLSLSLSEVFISAPGIRFTYTFLGMWVLVYVCVCLQRLVSLLL